MYSFVFFKDTATTEIYTYGHTLSLHAALPISSRCGTGRYGCAVRGRRYSVLAGLRGWLGKRKRPCVGLFLVFPETRGLRSGCVPLSASVWAEIGRAHV